MNYITADEALLARLDGIAVPVEIRDENGKVLGHYTPVRSPEEEALYERAKQVIDLEKAKRVAATERGQGRTTAEVLRQTPGDGALGMIYTVAWTPTADDELAEIWTNSTDRQDVADASDRIERNLRIDPLDKVQDLHEGLYLYVVKPLVVICEIHPDDRIVRIVQARRV